MPRTSKTLPVAEKSTRKAPTATSQAAIRPGSKGAAIVTLLRREGGATLDEMTQATGWQKHSVRGFLAGALKKRHGLTVRAEKIEKGRVYRVNKQAEK